MKKLSKLLLIIFFLVQIPFVSALECDDSQIKLLKEQAEAIVVDSEFDMESVNYGVYGNNIVTVQGLTEDLYMMTKEKDVGIFFEDVIEGVAKKIVGPSTSKFYVYSYTCPGVTLKTINLSLKKYNIYSDFEECDGIEEGELDVCNKYYSEDLDYEEFVSRVNKYKESQNSVMDVVNQVNNSYVYIAIGIFVILVIVIVIIAFRRKRNRLE